MIALALVLAPVPDIAVYGVGNMSCETAQTQPTAAQWVAGFWSGMNYSEGKTTGRNTDLSGIMGEIRIICQGEPSLPLMDAAARVYRKLEKQGR